MTYLHAIPIIIHSEVVACLTNDTSQLPARVYHESLKIGDHEYPVHLVQKMRVEPVFRQTATGLKMVEVSFVP
jgi:hypothetical protein